MNIFSHGGSLPPSIGKSIQPQKSMTNEQRDVEIFMAKAGQTAPEIPSMPDLDTRMLRVRLIAQELRELCHALGVYLHLDTTLSEDDSIQIVEAPLPTVGLKEVYDGVLDILYVTLGTAVAVSLQVQPGWEEVQRSNLTKFIDGHRAPSGKWIKGPSYSPANLQPIIDAQIEQAYAKQRQRLLQLSSTENSLGTDPS